MFFLSFFVMLSCVSVYCCLVVNCWERADLSALILWCLTVKLSLSYWYLGPSVVLDCFVSWSLPSFLLWTCFMEPTSPLFLMLTIYYIFIFRASLIVCVFPFKRAFFYFVWKVHLLVYCMERADALAFLYVRFPCVFDTFPYGILVRVWYLIQSIPNLCLLLAIFRRLLCELNISCTSLTAESKAKIWYQ